jgi:hypothetical protein
MASRVPARPPGASPYPGVLALLLVVSVFVAAGCQAGDAPSLREGGAGEAVGAEEAGTGSAADEAATGEADVVPREVPGGEVEQPPAPAGTGAGPTEERPERPPPPPVEIPDGGERPRFERPEHVRGVYLNAWTAGSSRRVRQLLDLARRTEINTFVIDLKDASGFVSYTTGLEEARAAGAVGEIRIHDLPGLLRRLEAEGIYPIARIVVVKDPILVAAHPDWAVQDTAGGVWVDSKGIRWLNPFDPRVQDYHLALAREAVALGFPEIQWDYVRFPDAPRSELERASYPGRDGRPRPEAIRAFLERGHEELGRVGAVVTADVFGVTTSARDVGIGQIWEELIDAVDVALPMVYPSHYYRGSFGFERPNAYPYEVVKHALDRALQRSARVEGAGATRPWLQDFSLGEPDYGAPEVRAQIQAAYDAGIDEWLLWNPASRFTEAALEPVGGWSEEPRVRVAGRVVPVSERHRALRMSEAEQEEDSVSPPDTTSGGGTGPPSALRR